MRKPKEPLRLFVLPEHIAQYFKWLQENGKDNVFIVTFENTRTGRIEIGLPQLKVKKGG